MSFKICLYEIKYKNSLKSLWEEVFNKTDLESEYLISWLLSSNSGLLILAVNKSEEVIGSRASWYWSFKNINTSYNSAQFGLTSVHPNFRRLGIFSMLNKSCIEILENEKIDFIYNVSLPKAKKGYEKMGWIYKDNLERLTRINFLYFLSPRNKSYRISNILNNELISRKSISDVEQENIFSSQKINKFINRFNMRVDIRIYESDGITIIYKKKKEKGINSIFIGEIYSNSKNLEILNTHLNTIQFAEKSFLISTYLSLNHPLNKYYLKFGFKNIKRKFQPIGVKLINQNIVMKEIHNNLVLSYIDLDTF